MASIILINNPKIHNKKSKIKVVDQAIENTQAKKQINPAITAKGSRQYNMCSSLEVFLRFNSDLILFCSAYNAMPDH